MSKPLFRFRFKGKLDWRRADALRAASGMRISLTDNYDREPGRGSIGDNVVLWLSEGEAPDSWEIEAWAHDPTDYDAEEVERRRQRIRGVLPHIADSWEEVGA